ncbi:MAG: Zn-ribbon domain-containing OB-fold protein, partial [Desulfosalsimonadaceae bacterium]|nr:Zn-ribbon domain-containing OB-fold protein [Desulfosalsimonadaceae bacterium]
METQRPIPAIQPWTKEFWKATKQGKLLVQQCADCKARIFFPKKACPECWSENLTWIESSGMAKIYTFTLMMDMVEPKFMADLPYIIAMVDLEEGIRMTTRIINCKPEDVCIGMDVEVVFQDLSPECSLPVFQPADASLRIAASDTEPAEKAVSEAATTLRPEDYKTI